VRRSRKRAAAKATGITSGWFLFVPPTPQDATRLVDGASKIAKCSCAPRRATSERNDVHFIAAIRHFDDGEAVPSNSTSKTRIRPRLATIAQVCCCRRMVRYFFHIDGSKPHLDEMGEVFAEDTAAWRAAVRLTRDIEDGFHPGLTWWLEVHDVCRSISSTAGRIGDADVRRGAARSGRYRPTQSAAASDYIQNGSSEPPSDRHFIDARAIHFQQLAIVVGCPWRTVGT
jgi:hypothetical protein